VDDRENRQNFVSRMGQVASDTDTLIAWALMSMYAHILLRSGPYGLSRYMRRLLTGLCHPLQSPVQLAQCYFRDEPNILNNARLVICEQR